VPEIATTPAAIFAHSLLQHRGSWWRQCRREACWCRRSRRNCAGKRVAIPNRRYPAHQAAVVGEFVLVERDPAIVQQPPLGGPETAVGRDRASGAVRRVCGTSTRSRDTGRPQLPDVKQGYEPKMRPLLLSRDWPMLIRHRSALYTASGR